MHIYFQGRWNNNKNIWIVVGVCEQQIVYF